MSAVVQQGLDLLRKQDEVDFLEAAALRMLLEDRMCGPFVAGADFAAQTDDMLAAKRRGFGLDG